MKFVKILAITLDHFCWKFFKIKHSYFFEKCFYFKLCNPSVFMFTYSTLSSLKRKIFLNNLLLFYVDLFIYFHLFPKIWKLEITQNLESLYKSFVHIFNFQHNEQSSIHIRFWFQHFQLFLSVWTSFNNSFHSYFLLNELLILLHLSTKNFHNFFDFI